MAKELYLYSYIYNDVAQKLIAQMEESKNESIVLRVNSGGGSVPSGWGIIAKMIEIGGVKMKVDGAADSMAFIMALFADDVEALDVTTFIAHRADMYVSSPEDQKWLDERNADIRKKMESKIDPLKWQDVTGVSFDELFNPSKRVDVTLTAKQAKQLGIVSKINKITPSEMAAFNERVFGLAAAVETSTNISVKQNIKTMDLNTLKAEHPALFASVVEIGIAKERDRVGALAAFMPIDPEAVTTAIKDGSELTQTFMAEMTVKGINANTLKKIESAAAPKVETTAVEKETTELTAEEKVKADFEAELDKKLGLTK